MPRGSLYHHQFGSPVAVLVDLEGVGVDKFSVPLSRLEGRERGSVAWKN